MGQNDFNGRVGEEAIRTPGQRGLLGGRVPLARHGIATQKVTQCQVVGPVFASARDVLRRYTHASVSVFTLSLLTCVRVLYHRPE